MNLEGLRVLSVAEHDDLLKDADRSRDARLYTWTFTAYAAYVVHACDG